MRQKKNPQKLKLNQMNKGAQILARRRVGIVELPVQRVDANGIGKYHDVMGVLLHVLGTLGVPAHDDANVVLASSEL